MYVDIENITLKSTRYYNDTLDLIDRKIIKKYCFMYVDIDDIVETRW